MKLSPKKNAHHELSPPQLYPRCSRQQKLLSECRTHSIVPAPEKSTGGPSSDAIRLASLPDKTAWGCQWCEDRPYNNKDISPLTACLHSIRSVAGHQVKHQ